MSSSPMPTLAARDEGSPIDSRKMTAPLSKSGSQEFPKVFRASKLWTLYLYAVAMVFPSGVLLFLADLSTTLRTVGLSQYNAPPFVLLAFCITGAVLVYFPGNWSAMLPYAVEVKSGLGLRLLAPFKDLFIPIDHVLDIDVSALWGGYVVNFRKRHRLLFQFYIPVFFGRQREHLARAIEDAINQHRTP